jgi:hypothetical protein
MLFWWEARSVRTDMLLTGWMALTLALVVSWYKSPNLWRLVALFGVIAAGAMTKGPPALVFPLMFAIFFYWRKKTLRETDWRRRMSALLIPVAAAMIPVLIWYVLSRHMSQGQGETSAARVDAMSGLFRQTIGRFFLGVSKAEYPWFYVFNLPWTLLPWSLLLPATALWIWRQRKTDERVRLLITWIIPAFIFFTICIGKRDIYLLPLYPAFAVLLAHALQESPWTDYVRTNRILTWGWIVLLAGVALIAIVMPLITSARPYWRPEFLLIAVLCLFYAVLTARDLIRNRAAGLPAMLAIQYATIGAMIVLFLFPVINQSKSARYICAELRQLTERKMDYDLYCAGFSREEYVFYTKHSHTPVLTDLLDYAPPQGTSFIENAKTQAKLRKDIFKAVSKVKVANIEAPTEAELLALRKVIDETIEKKSPDPETGRKFLEALLPEVGKLIEDLNHAKPSFMFVLEEDLNWLLPLQPDILKFPVIHHRAVGSRSVLLLANAAGKDLIAQVR